MQKTIFGNHDDNTLRQFNNCLDTGNVVGGVLCADGHYGYSQPVGGVVVYDGQISPSGVGYDIACGNKAVKTNLKYSDIKPHIGQIMDEIETSIRFGVGKRSSNHTDHPLFEDTSWSVFRDIGQHEHDTLLSLAKNQLGTCGSGNHYVDILIDENTDNVWVSNHFGSRGLGHKTATGFLNLANNREFQVNPPSDPMDAEPTLFDMNSDLGEMYFNAMELVGRYAYAGRDIVIDKVLAILQASELDSVHNHHNYAWKEIHNGKELIVVRKGATPAAPGQRGFVGGSMGDISVILEGKDSVKNRDAFYSTVHGAGRVMSRTKAAGKMNYRTRKRKGGIVSEDMMAKSISDYGVEVRGGGTDESPHVYRKLQDVLDAHSETINILNVLKPIGVLMD